MGFLDILDKVGDKLGSTFKAAGSATLQTPVGFALDLARLAAPDTSWLDRGFLGGIKGTEGLSNAADLLVGSNTLTGWTITKAGEGLNELLSFADDTAESAIYKGLAATTGDPLSWSEAWNVSKDRHIGKTLFLALDQGYSAIGFNPGEAGYFSSDTDKVFHKGPLRKAYDTDAWAKMEEDQGKEINVGADALGLGIAFWADPFVLGSKLTSVARTAGKDVSKVDDLARVMEEGGGARHPFIKSRTDKLIGTVKYDEVATPEGPETVASVAKGGWLDGKSVAEIYRGLGLDQHAKGDEIATALANTDKIEDVSVRVNARRDVLAAMGGDPEALIRLNQSVPELGYKFSNMRRGRGTGEIDAALADDANRAAIDAGEALPKFSQPDVVASVADELATHPTYNDWVHGNLTERTMRVSAKGNRAIARLHREGIARSGQLRTGFGPLDRAVDIRAALAARREGKQVEGESVVTDILNADDELVGAAPTEGLASGKVNQPKASWFLNGANSMPAKFLREGVKTISWASLKAAGWTSGAIPAAKLSDSLRGQHVYGLLNVEDPQLSIAVTQEMTRRAGMAPDRIDHYTSMVTRAENATTRAAAVKRAQEAAIKTIAERNGVDSDTVLRIAAGGERQREGMLAALRGQSFAATMKADGTRRVDEVVLPDDGGTIIVPVLNTQTPNDVTIIDLARADKFLRRDPFTRAVGAVEKFRREGGNPVRNRTEALGFKSPVIRYAESDSSGLIHAAVERSNTLWKHGALLTRPGGYALRNTAEEYMRTWALGKTALAVDESLAQHKYLTLTGKLNKLEDPEKRATLNLLKAERDDLKSLHDDDDILADVAAIKEELRSLRRQRGAALKENPNADVSELDSAINFNENLPVITEHAEWQAHLSAAQTRIQQLEDELANPLPASGTHAIEGVPGEFPDAYAGIEGRAAFERVTGSGQFDQAAAEYGERSFSRLRGVGTQDYLSVNTLKQPDDVVRTHLLGWERILNLQVRQDVAAQVALRAKAEGGDSDDMLHAVQQFLEGHTDEARRYRNKNPMRSGDTEAWASDISDMVDHYVPTSVTARELLERPIPRQELADAYDVSIRPDIHLTAADEVFGHGARKRENFAGNMYRAIDRMSLQQATRHPMYSIFFQEAQARRAEIAMRRVRLERGDDGVLTGDEINGLTQAAREEAALKLKQTFYDSTQRSTAAHQLRFIYPFFASHQNAMTFWGKAIANNPHLLRQFQLTYQAPASVGLVIDKDGNEVKPGTFIEPGHQLIVQMPESWGGPDPKKKKAGGGWRFTLQSFNLVTQNGSAINPGAGPLASIPAGYIQAKLGSRDENVSKLMTWFNPFGAPKGAGELGSVKDSILPTPIKRALDLFDAHTSQNSREYLDMWSIQMTDAQVKFFEKHDRPPNAQESRVMEREVTERTQAMALMRWAASIVSPAQPRPVSKFEAFREEYRRLAERGRKEGQGPFWAADKFLDIYGDAFMALTKSDSENRAHLNPSTATVRSLDAHKRLTDKTVPEAWALIVGPEGEGAFSIDAYRWMQGKVTGPNERLVDKKSQRGRMFDVAVAQGWREYTKQRNLLQAEAQRRGFDSYEEDPELKYAWQVWKKQHAKDFPQWDEARRGGGQGSDFNEVLSSVALIAKDKRLLNDPARGDIRLLGDYLQARKDVQQILEERAAQGGASTLEADANKDLRWAFATYVTMLGESNTAFFDYAFPNLIERDPLYDPDILAVK